MDTPKSKKVAWDSSALMKQIKKNVQSVGLLSVILPFTGITKLTIKGLDKQSF